MEYQIFGPFRLPRRPKRSRKQRDDVVEERTENSDSPLDFRTKEAINPFWEEVQEETGLSLRDGCGCYVFVTRGGPGYRPWYVGQSKTRFSQEVFALHKRKIYDSVMRDPGNKVGTPYLFLVTRMTPGGKLVKGKLSEREADFIERLIINHAYAKNPGLMNVAGTNFAKKLVIPGVFNDGSSRAKELEPTRELRKALGIP